MKYSVDNLAKQASRRIKDTFCQEDLLEKGKKKHKVGDIIVLGGVKYVVINKDGKQKYQYYGKGGKGKSTTEAGKVSTSEQTSSNVDSNGFTFVKSLGGSTGAELVQKGDKLFVRKKGAYLEHIRNEVRSLKYYKQMGVPVPNIELYDSHTGTAYFEYIEGVPLSDIFEHASAKTMADIKSKIKKHFAVDALMGNWDVIGLKYDNIIVDKNYIPYRVDVGGSLSYRAQGQQKSPAQWNGKSVAEFGTMKSCEFSLQSSAIFHDITDEEIKQQLELLKNNKPECLNNNSPFSKTLKERFETALALFADDKESAKSINDTSSKDTSSNKTSSNKTFTKTKFYNYFEGYLDNAKEYVKEFYAELNAELNFSDEEVDFIDENIHSILSSLDSYVEYKSFDENYATGSIDSFAKKNGITCLEAACIREYTGQIYKTYNQAMSRMIAGTDMTNLILNSKEDLKRYKIKSSQQLKKELESKSNYIEYIQAKLCARGLFKALQNKGPNVTPVNSVFYRNFGKEEQIDSLSKIFKSRSIVAQCRMSSKSHSSEKNIGDTYCKLKYMGAGLKIESISQHDNENEVLFPPFLPMKIEASVIYEPKGNLEKKQLQVIATNMSDSFFKGEKNIQLS